MVASRKSKLELSPTLLCFSLSLCSRVMGPWLAWVPLMAGKSIVILSRDSFLILSRDMCFSASARFLL